ncbi:hypothetical protein DAKH74_010140 [Maudiozyma humilis]|uniref:Uncharacterized protein n=1 Tax=Maudiozyma humilis TaxID=51915 RepID=A0AAV5RT25_MAUHU|nr:hypothetical protein DAKH74_010140 [Kazachstania humilis]
MVQSGHGRNAADGAVTNSTRHSESNVDKPKYFVADAIRIPMSPFQIKISKVVNQLTLDIDIETFRRARESIPNNLTPGYSHMKRHHAQATPLSPSSCCVLTIMAGPCSYHHTQPPLVK